MKESWKVAALLGKSTSNCGVEEEWNPGRREKREKGTKMVEGFEK